MKKQFSICHGAFRCNCRCLALFAVLALVPLLAQAETNRPSGTVVAWGSNNYRQTNVPVAAKSGVVAIAVGSCHVMALKSDGSVVAWGANSFGQTNVPVAAQSGVTAIAAGGYIGAGHSVALKGDGSVVAWGYTNCGGAYCGQTDVPVAAQSGVVAIAAGAMFTVALKSDGTLVAWGDNLYGQVNGIRTTGPPRSAVAVPVTLGGQVLSGVTAIAAGDFHTVALRTNGSVVAWGNNMSGQTSVPVAAKSGVVVIAARDAHSVALKSDGSVVAWGANSSGQTNVPVAAQSGVVAIAAGGIAGSGHTVAFKSDGSVMQWGYNPSAVPSDLPPALAIAAGGYVTVALVREPSLSLLRLEDQTLSLSWNGAGVLEQAKRLTSPGNRSQVRS